MEFEMEQGRERAGAPFTCLADLQHSATPKEEEAELFICSLSFKWEILCNYFQVSIL